MAIEKVSCKEVIVAQTMIMGNDTELYPMRIITQVFTKDGELIAEKDPINPRYSQAEMVAFANYCKSIKRGIDTDDIYTFLESIGRKH